MPFDRFLIAPFNTGLQTDLKPWLIPEDAFQALINAYVFRGTVRKRFGSVSMPFAASSQQQFSTRLRILLGTTDGAGNFSATVPGNVFAIGQMFSIASEIITVTAANTVITTGSSTPAYNTTTGAFSVTGASPNMFVYFYPSTPVMGITIYESGTYNNQPTYAFDTQFAYVWNPVTPAWQRSPQVIVGGPIWHGTDLDFFWTFNWQGTTTTSNPPAILFVSNFFANNPNGAATATDDPIWWFNGTTWTSATTSFNNAFFFRPGGGAPHTGPFVSTARIIVVFKNRTILLNTIENDGSGGAWGTGTNTNFVNRMRYSANGTPFATTSWYEVGQQDSAGNFATTAHFVDASTEEEIISAAFIKDRLIVFMQQSTWEIVYTGNEIAPFRWQKINSELGSEAQQSSIQHDKYILTMSNIGVHACNGANVDRIDQKIPDEIFTIKDKGLAIQRIAGIRDFFAECDYWSFVSDDGDKNNIYPNRVLLYNYQNDSWALNEDSFTAFGRFEQSFDVTWAIQQDTWENSTMTWNSGLDIAQFRQVLGGNAQGFVLMLQRDVTRNASSMQLTNASVTSGIVTLTIMNHTLQASDYSDYILIENISAGDTSLNGLYQVQSVIDANKITIINNTFAGPYLGGGTIARVSNPQILSKQWNPYINEGRNFFLQKIDFGVLATGEFGDGGQVTVDYYPNATELSMLQDGTASGAIIGTGVLETTPYDPALYPLESAQDRLWHPIYFQSTGNCIQIFVYMSTAQMTTTASALADLQIEGICLFTSKSSQRLQ